MLFVVRQWQTHRFRIDVGRRLRTPVPFHANMGTDDGCWEQTLEERRWPYDVSPELSRHFPAFSLLLLSHRSGDVCGS